MAIKPRQPAPTLEFDTLDRGRWSLAAQQPQNFTTTRRRSISS
jgi:hypothetical protein